MLKVLVLANQLFCILVIDIAIALGMVVPLRVICSNDEFSVKQVTVIPLVEVVHWKPPSRVIDEGKVSNNLVPE